MKKTGGNSGNPTTSTGTCYPDAWRFLIKEEEGYLVHGTVSTQNISEVPFGMQRVSHAWVETLPGYAWEPQTKQFYTKEAFQRVAEPIEEARYTVEEASIMLARVGKHGPWTAEERIQWIGR